MLLLVVTGFFSPSEISRLKNGNTLISLYKGSYKFIEVTRGKKVVWGVNDKIHDFYHGSTSITYLD